MTTDADPFFDSKIQSVSTANPGWQVKIKHLEKNTETKRFTVSNEESCPIVAWAVVGVWPVNRDDNPNDRIWQVEPLFLSNLGLINSTEYQWIYSDLEPEPGEPEVTVKIEILPPSNLQAENLKEEKK